MQDGAGRSGYSEGGGLQVLRHGPHGGEQVGRDGQVGGGGGGAGGRSAGPRRGEDQGALAGPPLRQAPGLDAR
jgi:hypothetical protein